MSDALDDTLTALNAKLRAMTGIVRWYDDPPESLNEFPCGISYVSAGDLNPMAGGWSLGRHTLTFNIYHARQVLPTAIDAAKVWPYRVLTALAADLTLGGTVETLVAAPPMLRYRFGPLQYGDNTHYGCTFDITAKIIATLTIG